jgi:hypothetical protein
LVSVWRRAADRPGFGEMRGRNVGACAERRGQAAPEWRRYRRTNAMFSAPYRPPPTATPHSCRPKLPARALRPPQVISAEITAIPAIERTVEPAAQPPDGRWVASARAVELCLAPAAPDLSFGGVRCRVASARRGATACAASRPSRRGCPVFVVRPNPSPRGQRFRVLAWGGWWYRLFRPRDNGSCGQSNAARVRGRHGEAEGRRRVRRG